MGDGLGEFGAGDVAPPPLGQQRPPVVVLRDAMGKLVMPLEKADITKLLATGWKPPMPFSVTARDGKTLIYVQLFRPTNFDA